MKRSMKLFSKFLRTAQVISKNPDRVKDVFEKVDGKVDKRQGPLGQIFVKTRLTGRMIQDYISGRYRHLPKRTLIMLIGAALYIISPFDAIVDYIPFIGYADDIFIFNLVYSQVSKDLAEYMEWVEDTGRAEEWKVKRQGK